MTVVRVRLAGGMQAEVYVSRGVRLSINPNDGDGGFRKRKSVSVRDAGAQRTDASAAHSRVARCGQGRCFML